jgi:tetratricopeptide (TPR) repeat protein
MANRIVPFVDWEIKSNYLYKNDLMLLDFLASNNWERPLYFASPSSVSKVLGIDKYCHQTGVVYKFIPVLADDYIAGLGGVDAEASYDILMNKCKWGNLNLPGVYVDRESYRNSMMHKQNFMRLAQALVNKGKNTEAVAVADRCLQEFPNEKMSFDYYMLPLAEVYYLAGDTIKANNFVKTLADIYTSNLTYYSSVSPEFSSFYEDDRMQAFAVMSRIWEYGRKYKQQQLLDEIKSKMMIPQEYMDLFN